MRYIDIPRDVAETLRVSNIPLKPGGKHTPENPAAFSLRPEREFFVPMAVAVLAEVEDRGPVVHCARQIDQIGALLDLQVSKRPLHPAISL